GVQTLDKERVEVTELDVAEARLDIPLHNLLVALRRRRLQRRHMPLEPLVEERTNGQRVRVADVAVQRTRERLLRLPTRREAALPPLAPAARVRVAADVHDVAPCLVALDDASSHSILRMRLAHCERSTRRVTCGPLVSKR